MFQRIRSYDSSNAQIGGIAARVRRAPERRNVGRLARVLPFGRASRDCHGTRDDTIPRRDLDWAAGLTPTCLEGALARALTLEARPPITAQLAEAEYEALEEADLLDRAAEEEQAFADAARIEAETLREERLATEEAIATVEETDAKLQVAVHVRAASQARAVAADASERREAAERANPPKRRRSKSKR